MELLALSEQQEIQRLSEIYKLLMVVLEEQQDQREMLQTAQPVLLDNTFCANSGAVVFAAFWHARLNASS